MTRNASDYSLKFLGTGSGGQPDMGCSAAVLELNQQPILLIDCGYGTLSAYQKHYKRLPQAIFITHGHLDHIADLEILTVQARLQEPPPIRLYVPLNLITLLHQRLATYPGAMAEGGHNFWQSFQLLPVTDTFIHQDLTFRLHATRHHQPGSSYALHLPGVLFYSGDTRPIPEILCHEMSGQERIFHDCGLQPNPSHTGLDDLAREYPPALRQRFVLYHYANEQAAATLEQAGYQVARPGDSISLGTESNA